MLRLPSICVVVLNWNCWQDSLECLHGLQQSDYPNYTTVVVDNGSSDGSEQRVRQAHPSIAFIQTGTNLGYAGGNNVGIRHALEHDADYVLLLNPDVVVEPDTLSNLVRVANRQPQAAALSPTIRYKDGARSVWFGGGTIDWTDLRTLHAYEQATGSEFNASAWASGCCILLRADALRRVGLFDSTFFLYCEEVDLCQKLLYFGYDVGVCGNFAVFHGVSRSVKLNSPKSVYYMTRSSLQFFARHSCNHGISRIRVIWRLYHRFALNRHTFRDVLQDDPRALARARACADFARRNFGRSDKYA